jgi:CheY-like chemotaxis protein
LIVEQIGREELEDGVGRTRGAILVVDDEPEIRALLLDCLAAAGYRAYDAGDATEALARLAQHSEIRLVLTDVVMPGAMSGFELAQAIAKTHPGLKVVFMSGYVPTPPPDLPDASAESMLRKPFKVQHVLATVETLLGREDNGE